MTLAHVRVVLILSLAVFIALAVYVAIVQTVPGDAIVREVVLLAASPSMLAVIHVVNMAGDGRLLLPGTLG